MEISSGLVNVSTQLAQNDTQQKTELAVLKKAIDMQETNALALIEALPDATSGSSQSAHLGQNIDVKV